MPSGGCLPQAARRPRPSYGDARAWIPFPPAGSLPSFPPPVRGATTPLPCGARHQAPLAGAMPYNAHGGEKVNDRRVICTSGVSRIPRSAKAEARHCGGDHRTFVLNRPDWPASPGPPADRSDRGQQRRPLDRGAFCSKLRGKPHGAKPTSPYPVPRGGRARSACWPPAPETPLASGRAPCLASRNPHSTYQWHSWTSCRKCLPTIATSMTLIIPSRFWSSRVGMGST